MGREKSGNTGAFLFMKVAIVGSEDFQNRKALLNALKHVLGGMHVELLIPCGSAEFMGELEGVAESLGFASDRSMHKKKNFRKIAQYADLCIAFTADGFLPDGEAYRVVEKFSAFSKPVNVIQMNANGNARKLLKLRHYKASNCAKSVSVMIVSSPVERSQKNITQAR